jgi:hypothetical protein
MAAPAMGPATTTSQLEVTVVAPVPGAATGGAAIDSYHVEWDQGTGVWADLAGQPGSYSLLTTLIVPGVTGGEAYRFRVTAHNVQGWGPVSGVGVIWATSTPAAPAPATTVEVNEYIEVRWSAPVSNFESLDAYSVAVESAAGPYYSDLASCDGSSAAVRAELRCRIPVSTLTAAPFALTSGATVVAIVQARNARGWGPYSAPNTVGAVISTVPHQMAAPVRDSAATTTQQITVNWLPLVSPADGMSPVRSYGLEWDAGSSGAAWSALAGLATDYLLTSYTVSSGVVPGESYRFRVRARNGLGWGPYSDSTTVAAATRPAQTPPVATALDPATGGLRVTITPPDSN